ncbi:DNA ligase D [Fredinandcohnia sp. QZ13]|uniref:DNA ligase D n=1 Tax=Fredinandcohnia sp. QZ13 TaxID=3073144 RepID=UPI0028531FC2|nr:DNA ligase D [Fredinandcohnia sp. QZ13]MDR4886941.1 DNA ligase D [Fredinandcohnia sp. QZ13]
MLKPMLPTLIFEAPTGPNWVYEIKYDGFRAMLHWDKDRIQLISRNGNLLNEQFPEIIKQCKGLSDVMKSYLPLVFDGELCILESSFKASFELIQQRGRLKSEAKIAQASASKPAQYLVFDLLVLGNENLMERKFQDRKTTLYNLFADVKLPSVVDPTNRELIQLVTYEQDFHSIWAVATQANAEGIIAKKIDSTWDEGKRTTNWYKIKNWQVGVFFILGYDKKNAFFHVGVMKKNEIYEIGLFSHGLSPDERQALLGVIQANAIEQTTGFIKVEPGICVELFYLELYKEQLRQPSFSKFRFDVEWQDCTWEKLVRKTPLLPEEIEITHPEKPLWKDKSITKLEYIHYLVEVSPYMLPFLKERLLTVIRYPHGMYGEKFYQKNCPDYAPDFIQTSLSEGIEYIVCNDLKTLTWLGNQLSFEFHIPFQTIYSKGPSEIVFDLDPPSRDAFPLAKKAATILKEVFDGLKLISFVKTSGNKGLQIYIPLPENRFTYDDTRQFTEFVANYLTTMEPDFFTTERLKKNRGNRLYVDYVQHAEGKTIVAPYSVRGNDGAYVATPLYWEEITDDLSIEDFPLESIIERINEKGCPFTHYFDAKDEQPFEPVLEFLRQK